MVMETRQLFFLHCEILEHISVHTERHRQAQMLDWQVTDTNGDSKKEKRLEQRLDQTHTATYREK